MPINTDTKLNPQEQKLIQALSPQTVHQHIPLCQLPSNAGKVMFAGAGGGSDVYSAYALSQLFVARGDITPKQVVIGACRHAPHPDVLKQDLDPICVTQNPKSGIYRTKLHNGPLPESVYLTNPQAPRGRLKPTQGFYAARFAKYTKDLTDCIEQRGLFSLTTIMEEHVPQPCYILGYDRSTFFPRHEQAMLDKLEQFYCSQGINTVVLVDTGGDILGRGMLEQHNKRNVEADVKTQVLHMRLRERLHKKGITFNLLTAVVAPCIDNQTDTHAMIDNIALAMRTKKVSAIKIDQSFIKNIDDLTQGQTPYKTTRLISKAYKDRAKTQQGFVACQARRPTKEQSHFYVPASFAQLVLFFKPDFEPFLDKTYGAHPYYDYLGPGKYAPKLQTTSQCLLPTYDDLPANGSSKLPKPR